MSKLSGYTGQWKRELKRPLVLLGLAAFALGVGLLWYSWTHQGRTTPFPLGVVMPF